MFGKLIGAGVGGYVFESTKNEGRCFKLVALPDKPLKFYGLKSDVGRVYGINENQADLFSMLSEATNPSSALPKVYKYYEGEVNKKIIGSNPTRKLLSSSTYWPRNCSLGNGKDSLCRIK